MNVLKNKGDQIYDQFNYNNNLPYKLQSNGGIKADRNVLHHNVYGGRS